jgi:hypothetical protein
MSPSIASALPLSLTQNDLSISRKSAFFQGRLHDSISSNILDRPRNSQLPRMTLTSVMEQHRDRSSLTLLSPNHGGPLHEASSFDENEMI